MDSILFYLEQMMPTLTKGERKIVLFIRNHPGQIPSMKISELGRETGTNPPAVTRLCKKIGLPGYPELKMEVAKELFRTSDGKGLHANLNAAIDLRKESELSSVIRNVIRTATDSFTYLGSLTQPENIKKTVDLIRGASTTLVVGLGASGLVALDMYQKLLRLGIQSTYNMETHLQMVSASTLKKRDLAYVISYSGETPEVVSIAKQAKNSGASLVAVTRLGNNSLKRISDLTLSIPDTESICRNGAFISRLDQMLINDMIFYTFLSQYYDEYQEKIDKTWKGVFSFSSKIVKRE